MLKYLPTEWTEFAYDLEYPGTAEDKFFYYLRTLGYTGSVDDMLYQAAEVAGFTTGSIMDRLNQWGGTDPAEFFGYVPNWVTFDGTNDYLTRASDFTGATDSATGIVSVWLDLDGSDSATNYVLYMATVRIYKATNGRIRIQLYDTDAALKLDYTSTASITAGSGKQHLLISWDSTIPSISIAIDGTVAQSAITNDATTVIDWTRSPIAVGASTAGTGKFNGQMADLWIAPGQYLDITDSDNVEKFRSADGKPVDLLADGTGPTGVAPLVFLNGTASTFNVNAGTGGDFVINGELS